MFRKKGRRGCIARLFFFCSIKHTSGGKVRRLRGQSAVLERATENGADSCQDERLNATFFASRTSSRGGDISRVRRSPLVGKDFGTQRGGGIERGCAAR